MKSPRLVVLAAITSIALALPLAQASADPVADPPSTAPLFSPQLVVVRTPTTADRSRLAALGLDGTDDADKLSSVVVLHTAAERESLAASGLRTRVQIADLFRREARNNRANAEYAARTQRSALPSGRDTYRTLDDYESEMKTLAQRHHGLIKRITLPHPTLDGRTVHGLEIGTDVTHPESGRPTLLMLGLHHAREWPSGEHTMEFAYDLVRGFGGNARITRLLKKVRVVIVPVVNADGFDLSRTSGGLIDLNVLNPLDPSDEVLPIASQLTPGFAYLRKNCRLVDGYDTPDGTCAAQLTTPAGFSLGVDLNRNYGMWWSGPGSAGTLPDVEGFTAGLLDPRYHGAAAFSEPETRNVRSLVLSRPVTTLITNHTSGNLVLWPWSGAPDNVSETGRRVGIARDDKALAALGKRFAAQNGYTAQRSYALYDGMGTTEDWAYGATGTFGYTFEIGPTEFHPPFEDVVDQYVGAGKYAGKGNRAAYLIALENAADAGQHSIISGRAPAGARLVLTRNADTPTWDGTSKATYRISIRVPRSGRFVWHVNPSTRPIVKGTESYHLTMRKHGRRLATRQVSVDRGERVRVDLRR